MSIQKNKKEKLIEDEEQPITEEKQIHEKKKKVLSQKVLENLALGRQKRIDNLELKRKERDEEKTLNKKVKKVNKILKEHFNDGEIPDTVVKPVLKKKVKKRRN